MGLLPLGALTNDYDPFHELDREASVRIHVETRGRNKRTVIEGLEHHKHLATLASALKARLATGGTVRDGAIELQGDHAKRAADVLRRLGFHP